MKKTDKTFTLIEMLVVVAVISVLAALLLPALGNARNLVKRATCSANLRQIHQGAMMYVTDYNGWLPPTDTTNSINIYYINLYAQQRNDAPWGAGSYARQGIGGVFFCPATGRAADSPSWSGGTEYALYFSNYANTVQNNGHTYADPLNAGCWNAVVGGALVANRRFDSIFGNCVLMSEKNYSDTRSSIVNNAGYLVAGNTGVYPSKTIGYANAWNYHNLSCNFLFKDGHVKAYKYRAASLFDYDYIPYSYAD